VLKPFCASAHDAKLDRKPWQVTSARSFFKSFNNDVGLMAPDTVLLVVNTRREAFGSPSSASISADNGMACSRPFFILAAGISHVGPL